MKVTELNHYVKFYHITSAKDEDRTDYYDKWYANFEVEFSGKDIDHIHSNSHDFTIYKAPLQALLKLAEALRKEGYEI